MAYGKTRAYYKIKELQKRIRIIQGGTSAGKTIAILLILLEIATREKKLITVVAESYPHLSRGALRDFKSIIDEDRGETTFREYYSIDENKASHIFTFANGSIIEFIALNEGTARGARRDILFINEANLINYETYQQLEVRTNEQVYLDFNPVNEFWAHTELVAKRDVDFIKLNYKDNDALSDNIVQSIESRKGDGNNNWWRVYGLGEIGSLEGNVYSGWLSYEDLPHGTRLRCYGVDFGFANDETAIVAVYEDEQGELYLDEKLYQTKLVSSQIVSACSKIVENTGDALFVCDSARPEIIEDMKRNGVRAIPCDKGKGSVLKGIDLVSQQKIHYRGKNIEREYLTYAWKKRRSGEVLDEPQDGNDHALDAIRYAILDINKPKIDWGGGVIV